MHCFEGHHVTTLGEITSKDGNRTEIQELDSISHVVHDGKSKASEIRSQLKNLESTSSRLSAQYNKAQNEINETFQYYTTLLEERKAEIMRDLDGHYTMKQMTLNAYSQKGQETIDKIYQVFILFLLVFQGIWSFLSLGRLYYNQMYSNGYFVNLWGKKSFSKLIQGWLQVHFMMKRLLIFF